MVFIKYLECGAPSSYLAQFDKFRPEFTLLKTVRSENDSQLVQLAEIPVCAVKRYVRDRLKRVDSSKQRPVLDVS